MSSVVEQKTPTNTGTACTTCGELIRQDYPVKYHDGSPFCVKRECEQAQGYESCISCGIELVKPDIVWHKKLPFCDLRCIYKIPTK